MDYNNDYNNYKLKYCIKKYNITKSQILMPDFT